MIFDQRDDAFVLGAVGVVVVGFVDQDHRFSGAFSMNSRTSFFGEMLAVGLFGLQM